MRSQDSAPATRFQEELEALLAEARAGSAEAVQTLVNKFADKLLTVIRAKIQPRIRTLFDSDDFLQDVRTRLVASQLPRGVFASVDAFVGYLVTVARNQVGEVNRKYLVAEEHNLNREVHVDEAQVREAGVSKQEVDPATELSEQDSAPLVEVRGYRGEKQRLVMFLTVPHNGLEDCADGQDACRILLREEAR